MTGAARRARPARPDATSAHATAKKSVKRGEMKAMELSRSSTSRSSASRPHTSRARPSSRSAPRRMRRAAAQRAAGQDHERHAAQEQLPAREGEHGVLDRAKHHLVDPEIVELNQPGAAAAIKPAGHNRRADQARTPAR